MASRCTGDARDQLRAKCAKKYVGGASIRALADHEGRSYAFMHRLLTEANVKMRGVGGANRKGKAKPQAST